jgi:signal peptide peptidase SppA
MFNDPYLMIDEIHLNNLVQKSGIIENINIKSVDMADVDGEELMIGTPVLQKAGSRAMISIDGPIAFNPSLIDRLIFNAVSTQDIMKAVADVSQDDQIESVVFNINSPGGEATKIHQVADMVDSLSKQKATASVNTGIMASAAYFIGSQVGKIFAEDKLNETGSIGTVTVINDYSEAAKQAGIKVTKIATGPLKGAGMMGTPITADIINMVQKKVNRIQENFSQAVERRRDADMSDGSEARSGQSFFFEEAQQLGLIDGIKTIDQAFEYLEQGNSFKRLKSI